MSAMVLRLDLYAVWGRAVAHAVGYGKQDARALGLAWAYRRTDPRRRQPAEGFAFAGYILHRAVREPGEVVGFTANGPIRWADEYDVVRDRIGDKAHDEILASAGELLFDEPIVALDETLRAAELLHHRLGRVGIGEPFRSLRVDRILAALRK